MLCMYMLKLLLSLSLSLSLSHSLTPPSLPPLVPLSQMEMSHALATMRVQEEATKIKDVAASKNPILARRAKKKAKGT